ncbi:MAG: right-handed parallel beta-helix repeat-containing protein [Actinobacteria bacterium]|nr:right-handed parallel beta-helix repeat-containing protein [Actinomycetota bacterium]
MSDPQHGFESGVDGWSPQGNSTLQAGTVASTGSGSLRVNVDPSGSWPDDTLTARAGTVPGTNGVPITAGHTYRGWFDVTPAKDTAPSPVRCELRWYDPAGQIVSTHTSATMVDEVAGQWMTPTCEATAPSGAAYAGLRVFVAEADQGEVHYLDNAWLVDLKGSGSGPTPERPPSDAASPSPGGEWPDAGSTGVPSGVPLTASGSITVTEGGAIVDAKDVVGCINIAAHNVTVRRTRVTMTAGGAGCTYPIRVMSGYAGAVIEDVEIDGTSTVGVAICCEEFTVRRANIHHSMDGIRVNGNNLVEDSYIHSLVVREGSHNDGIQSTGGRNIIIRHNHIDNRNPQTSAILIAPSIRPLVNVTVENNLLRGGGYTLYFFDRSGTVRGNRFDRSHRYGAVHSDSYAGVWSDNAYLDKTRLNCPAC